MGKRFGFNPDWVVHPGATLREWREENHLPVAAAATACARMPRALYERVEAGDEPITPTIADALAWGTHIPATLWLNLERIFRAGLAAGKTWTRFDVVPPAAPFRILDTPTAEQTATATEAYSRAKCPHNGARNCPACGMKNGYPPDYAARPAVPALDERKAIFEAGRATGTVEGWADYTEQVHEDEYDALARQLHESIAEGQSVALTAKALRILAASATDEGPREEFNERWCPNGCGTVLSPGQDHYDGQDGYVCRPAVPALDVERLALAMGRVIDTDDITLLRSDASLIAREYAALRSKEPTEWTDPKG